MKVVLLSDTHGALDPGVADVVTHCDIAVHAGDIGDLAVIRALVPRTGRIVAVRGNNDPPEQEGAWAHVPLEARLELPGGALLIVHGDRLLPASRRHELLRRRFPDARAVVYGHSHRLIIDTEQTPWVLNPGAAGRARTYGGASCLVLTIEDTRWQVEALRFPITITPRVRG